MAAAPHRSVKVTSAIAEAQIAGGTPKSRILSTCSMNATRWQGLYRMVNKNRRLQNALSMALTGSEAGDFEEEEEPAAGGARDGGASGVDATVDAEAEEDNDGDDEEDDEEFDEDDDDEARVQANLAANKEYPLAHRLLNEEGFKHNALLESMLVAPNEVSCIVQRHEGMGLSMGYQLAGVLKQGATSQRVQVVYGTTKEGEWKDVNAAALPVMFKKQREIFARQLEMRFKVSGTPDKHTLLALMMDPSVDTTEEEGIFCARPAAQTLMVGEYRRRLLRRLQLMRAATAADIAGPAAASAGSGPLPPAKRTAPIATPAAAKKGPGTVLSLIGSKSAGKAPVSSTTSTGDMLDVIKLEEAKYASMCIAVLKDPSTYFSDNLFDQALFWAQQKTALPVHYALWLGEVGCAKVASANVETVFSGAGRISAKSRTLDAELLSAYAFLHYNYKYDWLRPTLDEIVAAYKKLYGKESRESDGESEDSSADEQAAEEEGEGEEDEGEGAACAQCPA
eukprot:6697210-Prymnesium_polylepis.2